MMPQTPLSPPPLVYAHRGDRSRAPDNTLEAYGLAVDAGADGIELDVRPTQDGVLIMSHDDRSPDMPPFIEMTLAEVRSRTPWVPTFIETLRFVPDHIWLNVEIKSVPGDADFDPSREIVDQTVETIAEHDTIERILLSSFDPVAMQRASEIDVQLLRGQLIQQPVELEVGIAAAVAQGGHAVNPAMSYFATDPQTVVSSVHGAGLAVVVWGANTPSEVSVLVRSGVDVIITDDPAMARRVVDQL